MTNATSEFRTAAPIISTKSPPAGRVSMSRKTDPMPKRFVGFSYSLPA